MEFKPYSLKPLFHPSNTPNNNTNNNNGLNYQNSASISALNAVFKLNFEAVIACDNHIFVGTLDGTIIHLTMDFQAQNNTDLPNTQLIQIFNLEKNKKVQKLACHKKLKLLLVLCDNTLSIFNFNLEIQEQFEPQTQVTQFDLDFFSNQLDIGILCLVKQKNLKIYLLTNELVLRKNIPLNENIISLCYSGNNAIISDGNWYKLIDLRRSISVKLAPIQVKNTNYNPKLDLNSGGSLFNKKSIVIFIDDQEFMIVSGDENGTALGMFFNSNGDPSRGTLSWPHYPKWVGFDFPFTIAILPNNQVWIHNIINQQLFQKITLPDRLDLKGLVDHCDLQYFLPLLDQKLNRGRDEDLQASTLLTTNLVWGKNFILAFMLKPILLELDPLLDTYQLERSILIGEQYSTLLSSQSIHYYRMRRELEHIYQKCGLLYIQQTLLDDAIPLLIQGNLDPRVIINLFPDFYIPELDNNILLDPGILQLTSKLTNFKDIIKGSLTQNYLSNSNKEEEEKLEDLLLVKNFYQMLENYLIKLRVKYFDGDSDIIMNKEQLLALDSTLIKLFSLNDDSIQKLQNWLSLNQNSLQYLPDNCIEFLTKRNKKFSISLIYKKSGKFELVYEIWKDLYESKDSPFNNGENDLDKFIELTSLITDPDLIWSITIWLISKNSEYGIKNLKTLSNPTLEAIGIPKIIDYLTSLNLISCKIEFLEFLFSNEISKDELLHTELINCYLDKLVNLFGNEGELNRELRAQERAFIIHYTINPKSTFLTFLSSKSDNLSKLRLNLIQFLNFSQCLDYKLVLKKLISINLINFEKSVIYSKLNDYQKSIELLVNLQDFNQVELICGGFGKFDFGYLLKPKFPTNITLTNQDKLNNNGKNDLFIIGDDSISSDLLGEGNDWNRKKLFNCLLDCLLGFNDEHTVLIQVSSLLSRHYNMFELLDVLSKLPSHWSLDLFSAYFIKSLKKLNQTNNSLEIIKNLSISENIKTNYNLIETIQSVNKGQNGPILINETSKCGKCQKFLGDSVISILPIDKHSTNKYLPIYHLHCVQNQS